MLTLKRTTMIKDLPVRQEEWGYAWASQDPPDIQILLNIFGRLEALMWASGLKGIMFRM